MGLSNVCHILRKNDSKTKFARKQSLTTDKKFKNKNTNLQSIFEKKVHKLRQNKNFDGINHYGS